MIHDRVDIEYWKSMFPLVKLREQARNRLMQPGGEMVTSPYHIAVVEQIREEVSSTTNLGKRVPTDVFVFNKGEPDKREGTKVGGLPYWPADRQWPTSPSGKPLTFVAQFCFADSLDIAGPLPGEMLLIFSSYESEEDWYDDFDEKAGLFFRWVPLGQSRLIGEERIPPTEWKIKPRYGSIHRTVDYPDAEKLFKKYNQYWLLNIIEGTKIGRVPRWVQDDPGLPGRFLCSLGSVIPGSDVPFPYINEVEPIPLAVGEIVLSWGDAGVLYISVDEARQIRWDIQGY